MKQVNVTDPPKSLPWADSQCTCSASTDLSFSMHMGQMNPCARGREARGGDSYVHLWKLTHDSLASSLEAPDPVAVESPSPPDRLKCD